MRLYEFTNPSHYILPEPDAADLAKQNDDGKAANTTDITDSHLKNKPSTKKPTDTL